MKENMLEIFITAGQFIRLSDLGLGGKLLLQNQSGDVMHVYKTPTMPMKLTNSYALMYWQSIEIANTDSDIWVASESGGTLFVANATHIVQKIVEFPQDLLTSEIRGERRLRVDVGQTGFYKGTTWEFIRKVDSPVVFQFTCTVPFILHNQHLTASEGDIEMYAWGEQDITVAGTWSNTLKIWRQNEIKTTYPHHTTIKSGGTITVNNLQNYRDYARCKVSNSTAQRSTIQGSPSSERYHTPGVYYIQLVGTGVGSYHLTWEERV